MNASSFFSLQLERAGHFFFLFVLLSVSLSSSAESAALSQNWCKPEGGGVRGSVNGVKSIKCQ